MVIRFSSNFLLTQKFDSESLKSMLNLTQQILDQISPAQSALGESALVRQNVLVANIIVVLLLVVLVIIQHASGVTMN